LLACAIDGGFFDPVACATAALAILRKRGQAERESVPALLRFAGLR